MARAPPHRGIPTVSAIHCMESAYAIVGTSRASVRSKGQAVREGRLELSGIVGVLSTDEISSPRKPQLCSYSLSTDGISPTQITEDNLPYLKLADYGFQSHLQNTFAATCRLAFE